MKRATPERLKDIIEAAESVERLRPESREKFEADFTAQLAMTRLVEIVGEAANHVDVPVRDANPDVPWREIIAMRHRITHGYFDVDLDALWEVITADLPAVVPKIQAILNALPDTKN